MLSKYVTSDFLKKRIVIRKYLFLINSTFDVPQVSQIYPRQGWNEIDPEDVWTSFQNVFKMALESTSISLNFYFVSASYLTFSTEADAAVSEVKVFGLSTQRGSFVTWDKRTGKPFHNFITWKDLRADHLVKSWNNSWTIQVYYSNFKKYIYIYNSMLIRNCS